MMNEVKKYVTEIRQYFGDNTSQDKEEDAAQNFFKIITEFAVHYMKALKDIDEWAEQVIQSYLPFFLDELIDSIFIIQGT